MRLNKKERWFYRNIPTHAKVYYRDGGKLFHGVWFIPDGDCTDMFHDFAMLNLDVVSIGYFRA